MDPRSWQLENDDLAPSRARTYVDELLGSSDLALGGEALATVLLLVSELVTNAVRHGEPPLVLTVTGAESSLHVEVRDEGNPIPEQRATPGPFAEGGRGLFLVDALSTNWGITALPGTDGKSVWFDLAATSSDV